MKLNKEIISYFNDYENVLRSNNYFNLLGKKHNNGISEYINNQKEHLIFNAKIINKIIQGFNKDIIKIADIGSYPGTLAYILRKIFPPNKLKISIYDHPNIINENQTYFDFCKENQISSNPLDLKNFKNLNDEFDIIIMSEVLEHLPSNPYHILRKLNNSLLENGIFYLTVPNSAKLKNRIKFFFGLSIYENVNSYFVEEDHPNNLYGYHWREFTTKEISSILQHLNLNIEKLETIGYDNKLQNKLILIINKIFKTNFGQKIVSISSKK